MPTHEEQLRREQELFEKKEELREQSRESESAQIPERAAQIIAESQRVEATRLHDTLKGDAFSESQLALLPKQSEPTKEAVEQLFHHLVERKDKPPADSIKKQQKTSTPVDRKTGMRYAEPRHREPDDLFATGIEGDFVPNTKISAADFDVHPSSDDGIDWGGSSPRRRRRRGKPGPIVPKKTQTDGK
ncbi:MAG: hypothetical protein U0745_07070 [Polyangia bacterium]|jgi:hypothetical protein